MFVCLGATTLCFCASNKGGSRSSSGWKVRQAKAVIRMLQSRARESLQLGTSASRSSFRVTSELCVLHLPYRQPDTSLWLSNAPARWQPDPCTEWGLGPQQPQHAVQVGAAWQMARTQSGKSQSQTPLCIRFMHPSLCFLLCRVDEDFVYRFDDEPTPSPQGYGGTPNPQTPGYPDPSSPQVNPPYNPQTPGTPAM